MNEFEKKVSAFIKAIENLAKAGIEVNVSMKLEEIQKMIALEVGGQTKTDNGEAVNIYKKELRKRLGIDK